MKRIMLLSLLLLTGCGDPSGNKTTTPAPGTTITTPATISLPAGQPGITTQIRATTPPNPTQDNQPVTATVQADTNLQSPRMVILGIAPVDQALLPELAAWTMISEPLSLQAGQALQVQASFNRSDLGEGQHVMRLFSTSSLTQGSLKAASAAPDWTPIGQAVEITVDHPDSFSVNASAGPGGRIVIAGERQVPYATRARYTLIPNPGYQVDEVYGCKGYFQPESGNVTFISLPLYEACNVHATFEARPSEITVTKRAGPGGTFNDLEPTTLIAGEQAIFRLMPDTGYQVERVSGCGATEISLNGMPGPLYNTNTVTSCTVEATFRSATPTPAPAPTPPTPPVPTPPATYRIDVQVSGSGWVNPTTREGMVAGQQARFKLTPATGWATGSVTGCQGQLSGDEYTTGAAQASNCTIQVTFRQVPTSPQDHLVSLSHTSGGTTNPADSFRTRHGSTAVVKVIPDAGYAFDGISADSSTMCPQIFDWSNMMLNIGPVDHDCQLRVHFRSTGQATHTITTSVGAGGQLLPAGPIGIKHGESKIFTVLPASGNQTNSVTGCSGTLSADGLNYTTGPIMQDCTITATFQGIPSVKVYQVRAEVSSGGRILNDPRPAVQEGRRAEFKLQPDPGYLARSATADPGCSGIFSIDQLTYTTDPIYRDCNYQINFEPYQVTPSPISVSCPAEVQLFKKVSCSVRVNGQPGEYLISTTPKAPEGAYLVQDYSTSGFSFTAEKAATYSVKVVPLSDRNASATAVIIAR